MKQSHNWVSLENPRNGKIQVRVCSKCGVMKLASNSLVAECKPKDSSIRSISDLKQVSVEVKT